MPRFGSHRVLAPGVFMEVEGVDFEDFEVGQIFEHRPGRTFTAKVDSVESHARPTCAAPAQ